MTKWGGPHRCVVQGDNWVEAKGAAEAVLPGACCPVWGAMGPFPSQRCPEAEGQEAGAEHGLQHLQSLVQACVHQEAPPGLGRDRTCQDRAFPQKQKVRKTCEQRRKSSLVKRKRNGLPSS